jgi:hypothetical protein
MRTLAVRFLLPALFCVASGLAGSGCADCADTVSGFDVTVVDWSGKPVEDATVTYTMNGGPARSCGLGGDPPSYECPLPEESGDLVVTASHDGMSETGPAYFNLDRCPHILSIFVTITLPCT